MLGFGRVRTFNLRSVVGIGAVVESSRLTVGRYWPIVRNHSFNTKLVVVTPINFESIFMQGFRSRHTHQVLPGLLDLVKIQAVER